MSFVTVRPAVMQEVMTLLHARPQESAEDLISAQKSYIVKEGQKQVHLSWGSIVSIFFFLNVGRRLAKTKQNKKNAGSYGALNSEGSS